MTATPATGGASTKLPLVTAPAAPDGAQSLRARLFATRDWLPRGRSLPLVDARRRHGWLLALLWAHALVVPLFAMYRDYSVLHSVAEGGILAVLAAAATFLPLSLRWRGAVTAFGLITASAVLVHVSGGYIEAHFHFFVMIILLTLYEDWLPFLMSFGYVILHHGGVGAIYPEAVYNHPDAVAHPWKWALVHGAFVSAAGIGGIASWRLNEIARAHAGEATARARQSEEANELKSRFIAMTSHELRTPLTSIGGFASTLVHRWDEIDDADKLRMLSIVEAQSGRLRHLIEDLLILSAVESGRLALRPNAIDVRAAVEEAVQQAGAAPVDVVVAEGLWATADRRYFVQVLANFLSNAQKYGKPPITLRATPAGDWLELAVSDRGRGVPEDFLQQLFEPFTRAADDAGVPGSGLGLSIVRGLVEAQGGYVWYEPNTPHGAVFKARFPQARPDRGDADAVD